MTIRSAGGFAAASTRLSAIVFAACLKLEGSFRRRFLSGQPLRQSSQGHDASVSQFALETADLAVQFTNLRAQARLRNPPDGDPADREEERRKGQRKFRVGLEPKMFHQPSLRYPRGPVASPYLGRLSFSLMWRARQDSNLWPLPSEGNALSS